MTDLQRFKCFENELATINSSELNKFAIYCLTQAPEYFFHIPASSTSKHHPSEDLGEGGLIRHSKKVIIMALDLLRCGCPILDQKFSEEDYTDMIILVGMFHDVMKNGAEADENNIVQDDGSKTKKNHPQLAMEFINNCIGKCECQFSAKESEILSWVMHGILYHMGRWSYDVCGNPLNYAMDSFAQLIHISDYIVSRRYINFDLEKLDKQNEGQW